MATTGKVNGTSMLMYIGGTAVSGSTDVSFSQSHSPRDTTTKDDGGYTTALEGQRSWTMSCSGLVFYDATYGIEEVNALQTARTLSTIKIGTEVVGDPRWTGTAYVTSIDVESTVEESVSWSASFQGSAALTMETVT